MRSLVPLLFLLACKSDSRLYSESEIAKLTDAVTARLAENAKRTCPAPKMPGPTSTGPNAELIELVEGAPELAPCIGKTPAAGCAALLAPLFHGAASHDQGCSPWQLGVRAEAATWTSVLAYAKVLAADTQTDPATALGTLLDAFRVMQDLMRGHVSLISAIVASKSTEIMAARADAILETAELAAPQLDTLAEALDRLIAAMPTFGQIQAGDRDSRELIFGLTQLAPADWTPPGGWNQELHAIRAHMHDGVKSEGELRDMMAGLLVINEKEWAQRAAACPEAATFEACRSALDKLGKTPPPTDDEMKAKMMMETPRDRLVEIGLAVGDANTARYVTKIADALTALVELRIHVEVLRTHACDPGALAALVPASLGAPIAMKVDGKTLQVGAAKLTCR